MEERETQQKSRRGFAAMSPERQREIAILFLCRDTL